MITILCYCFIVASLITLTWAQFKCSGTVEIFIFVYFQVDAIETAMILKVCEVNLKQGSRGASPVLVNCTECILDCYIRV